MGSTSPGGMRTALAPRVGSRNSLSLLLKNVPLPVVPHILPFFLPGQLARLLTAAATGTLRAHLEGLSGAWEQRHKTLKKRREIQDRKKVSNAYVRRLLRESSIAAARSIARRLRGRLVA